jgi:hypothetical protein
VPVPPPTLNKIVLLVVSGLSEDAVICACQDNLGLPDADAKAAYAEARRRVCLAAQYHPDEQLGVSITRLNDLYARSLKIQDTKTALSVQKELNRLMDLDRRPPAPGEITAAADSEDGKAARLHLEPLRLGGPGDALAELCRLAALKIIELEGRAR